jgi:hypothetical protein
MNKNNSKDPQLPQTAVRRSASIEVITVPRHISLTCPHCDEELEILYNDFCEMVGEPCDWKYSALDCPECEKSIETDSVDWV